MQKKEKKRKKALRISKTSNDENTQGDHEGAASANSGGVVAHVNPLLYTPSQRSLHQGSWTFCTDKLTSKKKGQNGSYSLLPENKSMEWETVFSSQNQR